MVAKVLTKEGAAVWEMPMLYKAVFQTVLLYGNEIWVATGVMLMVIESFYHLVVRKIAGDTSRSAGDVVW